MPDDETTQRRVEADEALAQRNTIRGRNRLIVGGEAAGSDLLADDEIRLIQRALAEWGGPARCSDHLAVGIGFTDRRDLLDQCNRLRNALACDVPLTQTDWARVLLATEIVFVSDLMGSGVEWSTTTGLSDESTIRALRKIQRKLGRTIGPYYGKTPGE
ncbi:hypothetical protein AB0D94_25830 [Streptomyces sp. NPDC048255]|uniref:hypothetical protein n=1 Tax=Streptomyces sp. NPDC048255 TaxID=3154713 RepID=UPI0033DB6F7A